MKTSKATVKNNVSDKDGIAQLASAHFQTPRAARCGQCNKVLRHLPFAIDHIICRECYGLDRYRRQSLVPPGAAAEPVVTVAPRTALAENPTAKPTAPTQREKSSEIPKA